MNEYFQEQQESCNFLENDETHTSLTLIRLLPAPRKAAKTLYQSIIILQYNLTDMSLAVLILRQSFIRATVAQ